MLNLKHPENLVLFKKYYENLPTHIAPLCLETGLWLAENLNLSTEKIKKIIDGLLANPPKYGYINPFYVAGYIFDVVFGKRDSRQTPKNKQIMELVEAYFKEINPILIKYASESMELNGYNNQSYADLIQYVKQLKERGPY